MYHNGAVEIIVRAILRTSCASAVFIDLDNPVCKHPYNHAVNRIGFFDVWICHEESAVRPATRGTSHNGANVQYIFTNAVSYDFETMVSYCVI